MKLTRITGNLNQEGDIFLHPDFPIPWKSFSNKRAPELPQGTLISIDISFDENSLLSGEHGIVWATYNLRQAEVISNALLAQNISSTIVKIDLDDSTLLLTKVDNKADTGEAADFIWRKEGGLRLKPDWTYPDGEPNKSFEKWLNG